MSSALRLLCYMLEAWICYSYCYKNNPTGRTKQPRQLISQRAALPACQAVMAWHDSTHSRVLLKQPICASKMHAGVYVPAFTREGQARSRDVMAVRILLHHSRRGHRQAH